MNHLIEYFHSLVEHKFERDQYEVTYMDCQYHVKIKINDLMIFSLSNNFQFIAQQRMRDVIKHYLKPDQYCISVDFEQTKLKKNIQLNYPIMSEITDLSNHVKRYT